MWPRRERAPGVPGPDRAALLPPRAPHRIRGRGGPGPRAGRAVAARGAVRAPPRFRLLQLTPVPRHGCGEGSRAPAGRALNSAPSPASADGRRGGQMSLLDVFSRRVPVLGRGDRSGGTPSAGRSRDARDDSREEAPCRQPRGCPCAGGPAGEGQYGTPPCGSPPPGSGWFARTGSTSSPSSGEPRPVPSPPQGRGPVTPVRREASPPTAPPRVRTPPQDTAAGVTGAAAVAGAAARAVGQTTGVPCTRLSIPRSSYFLSMSAIWRSGSVDDEEQRFSGSSGGVARVEYRWLRTAARCRPAKRRVPPGRGSGQKRWLQAQVAAVVLPLPSVGGCLPLSSTSRSEPGEGIPRSSTTAVV